MAALAGGLLQGTSVVCVGSDGHVAVEASGLGVHDEGSSVCTVPADQASQCADACGPCRDVDLLVEGRLPEKVQLELDAASTMASAALVARAGPALLVSRTTSPARPSGWLVADAAHRRTVLLLI